MRAAFVALPAVLFLGLGLAPGDGAAPDPDLERGRHFFETVCVGCHTVGPPPDSAPPMAHVVRHLRMELGTQEAFAEHVRTYLAAPAPERSLLPAMAIERFGLMPPLPLGDSILTDVAAYVWTLADSARSGRGMGMMGRGRMGPPADTDGMGRGGMRGMGPGCCAGGIQDPGCVGGCRGAACSGGCRGPAMRSCPGGGCAGGACAAPGRRHHHHHRGGGR